MLLKHWTQSWFGTSQNGVGTLHAVWFVAEHSKQAPSTHAGAACVGHARVAVVEPKSPLQPTHWP